MKNNSIFFNIKDKIPKESIYYIKDKIDNISEEQNNKLQLLDLKIPLVGLALGCTLGLFGIDRYYKGDILLGVIKSIFGVIYLVCYIALDMDVSEEIMALCGLFMIPSLIWWISDLFLVFKGIKKDNFIKIQMCI